MNFKGARCYVITTPPPESHDCTEVTINASEVSKAMGGIFNGFIWEETPQGSRYWAEVHNNLKALHEEAPNED